MPKLPPTSDADAKIIGDAFGRTYRDKAANDVMDKLERGLMPTERELRAAGFCLMCSGCGYIYVGDGDNQKTCHHCGGDGLLKRRKI